MTPSDYPVLLMLRIEPCNDLARQASTALAVAAAALRQAGFKVYAEGRFRADDGNRGIVDLEDA